MRLGQDAASFDLGVDRVRQALIGDLRLALAGQTVRQWRRDDPDIVALSADLAAPSAAFVGQLRDLRLVIESRAAASAACERTEAQVSLMGQALTAMAPHGLDGAVGRRAELAFHQALFAATHDPALIALGQAVACAMRLSPSSTDAGQSRGGLTDRWRAWDWIRARRPLEARAAMRQALAAS